MMAAPRPQQPHGMKLAEMKKAAVVGRKKVAGKLEGVHQLRLLDNRYVQYRLLNARGHRRPRKMEMGWWRRKAVECCRHYSNPHLWIRDVSRVGRWGMAVTG
ncbi:hypothetical protein VPH35_113032 [Triticum aestivum]